jgi:Flp pilus assembly protein TadG
VVSRRGRGQRGQAMVEFALVLPVLLMLLGGLYDLGIVLRSHMAIVYAARQGALAAAASGTRNTADCMALAAIASALDDQPGITIVDISIYQPRDDGLPVGGAGNTGFADVYPGNPGCSTLSQLPMPQPGNWLPANRITTPVGSRSIGIEIDYTYSWQMVPVTIGSLHISDRAVMPYGP